MCLAGICVVSALIGCQRRSGGGWIQPHILPAHHLCKQIAVGRVIMQGCHLQHLQHQGTYVPLLNCHGDTRQRELACKIKFRRGIKGRREACYGCAIKAQSLVQLLTQLTIFEVQWDENSLERMKSPHNALPVFWHGATCLPLLSSILVPFIQKTLRSD